jgi:hypothetical protein
MDHKEYQCGYCLKMDAGRSPELAKKRRMLKGCWKLAPSRVKILDFIQFKRCPGNYHSDQVSNLVRVHQAMEQGAMPFNGGFAEQPAKLIEAVGLISAYRNEKLEKDLEAQKRKDSVRGQGGKRYQNRR